ncbi:MAG: ABC transporter permease [Chloroflexi bacterium]|nr:ABC transporter permease [Chloroflexota bacterium]
MQPERVLILARRIVQQIRRDHRSVGLIFFVPMLVMGLLGFILRIQASPIEVGVVIEDEGVRLPPNLHLSAAEELVKTLRENDRLRVRSIEREEAESELRDGSLEVVLIFPAELTRGLLQGSGAQIQILLEGSNPGQSGAILATLSATLSQRLASIAPSPGGPSIFLLTGVSFLRERAQGTMERLLATPISRAEIVLGYMLGFGVFALLQSAVILLFTIFVLRIHYVGNLALVFLLEAILTVGAVNLGIFLSTYARTELQVVQFIPLVIVPQALLSGILLPVKDLPGFLQAIAYLMPLTYANRAMTGVMIKSFGLGQVAPDLAILLAFAVGALLLSATTLRREIV